MVWEINIENGPFQQVFGAKLGEDDLLL